MAYQNIFKRYEIKFLINKEQYLFIKDFISSHMIADKYGKSTICNIYFDTNDFCLIRHSIEKPVYKEKLRVRSYGVADKNTEVFLELKKKYKSVVYKRRINMPENSAIEYLCHGKKFEDTQISREIDYFMDYYNTLKPAVFISYGREAYYGKNDANFRITFDNILFRDYDLSLCKGIYGTPVLDENTVLMEIKTDLAIPLWLTAFLSENHIYKTSFSKYGRAYEIIYNKKQKELNYV